MEFYDKILKARNTIGTAFDVEEICKYHPLDQKIIKY
jgi:hypothetical protein